RPQPACPPSTRPQISTPTPLDTNPSAGTSRRALGPWLSWSQIAAPMVARIPMGTFTQKIQCQVRPSVIAPPISGPAATATPAIPPQIPTTAPRFCAGNAEVSKVRPKGVTIAPPPPGTARQPMRPPDLGATAQAADAAVNTARPAT